MVWFLTFLVQLAVGLTLAVIAYVLAPKPKTGQSGATKDLENPTSEAGRPWPVVFGTMTVKGGNILAFSDKGKKDYNVNA